MKSRALFLFSFLATGMCAGAFAAEPVAAKSATSTPKPSAEIAADEPLTAAFSLRKAADYLDATALDWQTSHACIACHTMLPYMMARPALHAVSPQSAEVRRFFEEIASGKRDAMPAYQCKDIGGAVAVGVASALAINDHWTTGTLHPLTRAALDRMWTGQRPDGSWEWPFRDTPPLKINEHYGVTIAAVATGMAPDGYSKTPAATAGLNRIRKYLQNNPAVSLHQRTMLLWASASVSDLLDKPTKQKSLAELLAAQRPDGGWSLASFIDNTGDPALSGSTRVAKAKSAVGYGTQFLAYVGRDGDYKSSLSSDGYATGFAIFVARQAGVSAGDASLRRGIAWLKANQRQSGRWFTPSQSWHTQNLISNAGTGYAVLALNACGEVLANERPESARRSRTTP